MDGEPGVSNHQCPDGEITRGQGIFLQQCDGQQLNGLVQWTGCASASSPISTFGLPCELLVNDSATSYTGPYTPFFSGAKQATYAPNETGAFTFWTSACPHSNGS
jgi:hypothetical protein